MPPAASLGQRVRKQVVRATYSLKFVTPFNVGILRRIISTIFR